MFNLLRWLRKQKLSGQKRRTKNRPQRVRPQVEFLEDRIVPTTIRTITYDQVTSLPSTTPLYTASQFNMLDANGN
jgi:hypothetical protein